MVGVGEKSDDFVAGCSSPAFTISESMVPGKTRMVLILARDRDQSKIVFGYIAGIIKAVPALRAIVVTWRQDEIELNNGIVIAVKASDFRSVHGVTLVETIADGVVFGIARMFLPTRRFSKP